MDDPVVQHIRRLRIVALSSAFNLVICAGIVIALPDPKAPAVPQAGTLLWGFAFVAVVNLATVMPSFRAMMAAPLRAFAVGHQAERLLAAHFNSYLVALARVEAVAVLGLALFFLTGRHDWFWVFWAFAALAALLLWPNRSKVAALVVLPGEEPSTPVR